MALQLRSLDVTIKRDNCCTVVKMDAIGHITSANLFDLHSFLEAYNVDAKMAKENGILLGTFIRTVALIY